MATDVKQIAEKLKGKTAKYKKLNAEPSGTSGKKLPKPVAKGLEEVFSTRLNKVEVHTGGNAADLCKQMKVQAFTYGNKIYVAKPGYAKDQKILAHELTHVVQQGAGRMPKPRPGKALVSK